MSIGGGGAFAFGEFSRRALALMDWWREGSPYEGYDGVVADGSVRSTKTITMICGFLVWSQECFEHQDFIIAGRSIGSLKRNVISPMLKILRTWGWAYTYNRSGDSFIRIGTNTYYLFGASTEASQDTIQGLTAAGALADEAALFPQSFFDQMTARCSVDGAKIWANCNPRGPLHWFKREVIDKASEKRYCYLHFTMADNLSMPESVKARYRRMFSGVFFQRYILGLWVQAEGLIYDMFSTKRHVLKPGDVVSATAINGREHSEWYVSCDYGTQNATVFQLWGKVSSKLHRGRWVCEKHYRYSGRETQVYKTDAEYYDDLCTFVDDAGVVPKNVIIDPSAASFIATIKKGGRFVVKKAKNDVLTGIREMATAFCEDLIAIAEECVPFIDELQGYSWDPKAVARGDDKPLKVNDHDCDGGRYFVLTIVRGTRSVEVLR